MRGDTTDAQTAARKWFSIAMDYESQAARAERENERLHVELKAQADAHRNDVLCAEQNLERAEKAEQQLARVLAGECIAYDGADEPGAGSPNESGCPHCWQARAEQQLAEARAVIRLLQQADGRCQVCAATMWGTHTSDCRLAAILKETP